jgi:hypothetical protein
MSATADIVECQVDAVIQIAEAARQPTASRDRLHVGARQNLLSVVARQHGLALSLAAVIDLPGRRSTIPRHEKAKKAFRQSTSEAEPIQRPAWREQWRDVDELAKRMAKADAVKK